MQQSPQPKGQHIHEWQPWRGFSQPILLTGLGTYGVCSNRCAKYKDTVQEQQKLLLSRAFPESVVSIFFKHGMESDQLCLLEQFAQLFLMANLAQLRCCSSPQSTFYKRKHYQSNEFCSSREDIIYFLLIQSL